MALHLPINGVCNIKCVFCSSEGRTGGYELPDLLREISEDSTGHIQISGGDPMLREPLEVLAIVAHAKKLGKIVEFQTNAVLVEKWDPKRLTQLAGLVDFWNVNFSAHTPELDVAVTESPGAFAARVRGVKILLTLGKPVRLNYIVHEINYRAAEDFVKFAVKELPGFSWIQFSYVKGMGRAKNNQLIMPRFRDAAPYLNRAFKLCDQLGVNFDVDHIPVCFVMEWKEHHADYRKMRSAAVGRHLSEKQQIADCDGCAMHDVCPGPRKDYIEVYGAL
ncbi:MAG: radical SAM protein [Elusimicrobiota bacterium]